MLALRLCVGICAAIAVLLVLFMVRDVPPDPSARQQIEEAVRAFHGGLCADPRGALADGSCDE